MKNQNYAKGRLGEQIAGDFLRKKGYRVVETNFRTQFGEIDIIAAKEGRLVFMEVKLKVTEDFGRPEEMITPAKVAQVRQTAEAFLQQNPAIAANFLQYRIDAVCIVLNEDYSVREIRHYENL